LSTRTRLLLLDLLIQQERSRFVCDLLPSFARDQPTISHYLRTLLVAGFVDTEKRSIWAHPFRTASKWRSIHPAQSWGRTARSNPAS